MKRLLSTTILLCCIFTVFGQNKNFTLNGYILQHDYDGLYIYLIRNDVVNRLYDQKIDSAKIENGCYHFSFNATETPYVASLALPPKDNHFDYGLPTAYCIVEPGDIRISYTDSGPQLSGGYINKQYDDLLLSKERDIHKQTNEMIEERNAIETKRAFTDAENDNYSKRIDSLYENLKPYYIQFVSNNVKNDVGAFFFFFHPKEYYGEEYAKLSVQIKPEYFTKLAEKKKAEQEAMAYETQARMMTKVGRPYRDIISKTTDGKCVKLSDYIKSGHITLVDFWASWCVPCMMELKNLKILYAKYHSKGLNIISISLDTKKEAWLNAIKKQQIPWTQLSDLKGWQGKVTKDYAISAIPYVILIDQQGKIAVLNLYGNLLERSIKRLLNTK